MIDDNFEIDLQSIIDIDSDEIVQISKEPMPIHVQEESTHVEVVKDTSNLNDNDSYSEDLEFVRDNLKGIISDSSTALKNLSSVAYESESPRAYEVLAKLVDSFVSSNKELLNLHKMKDERAVKSGGVTNIQNNTVYVGSTKDFSKMIKNINAEKEIEADE